MADEMPASDALCEAMEYLIKLATNLRSRSKSLKEKRISKDKLNNTLAVHKAASKMLMICELSKKSLDNVESGVKKMLKLVNESRYSPKTSAAKTKPDLPSRTKYRYFKYDNIKLKVCKKVPVKHYMSVKVLSRCMPLSMQEKYPVYHDCQLYHYRRLTTTQDVNNSNSCETEDSTGKKRTDSSVISSQARTEQSNEATGNKDHNREGNVSANEYGAKCNAKDGEKNCELEYSKKENSIKAINLNIRKSTENRQELKRNGLQTQLGNESLDDNLKTNSNKIIMKHKRFRNIKIIADSSEESQDAKMDLLKGNDNEESGDQDKECNNSTINNSTADNSIEQMHKECRTNNAVTKDENKQSDSECNIERVQVHNDSQKSTAMDQNMTSAETLEKPLIKCVNINALLKPSVVENVDKTAKKQDFRSEKQKEISSFVSKKFSIKVTRIPKLSAKFLTKYNLKKITHKGTVLFEMNMSSESNNQTIGSDNDFHCEDDVTIQNSKRRIDESINKVKRALLDNSDDDITKKITEEAEKVKNALLNESDSDPNKTDNYHISDQTNGKKVNNTHNLTEDKQEANAIKTSEEVDKIKSSLLNDSSDNTGNTALNKRKESESTPSKSKRKSIMESMHAKKMLLTYSSSSDTEDDQLKNVLKEIKNDLLKAVSSEEENSVQDSDKKSSDTDIEINQTVSQKKIKLSFYKLKKKKPESDETDKEREEYRDDISNSSSSKVRSHQQL